MNGSIQRRAGAAVTRRSVSFEVMQLVEVEVARLGIDRASSTYVVVLQEKGGARLLPIWIGQAEAESIVIQMHGMHRERPLTHDLCKNVITNLGATLRRVQITRVAERTYYAELHLRAGRQRRSSMRVRRTASRSRCDSARRYSRARSC